MADVVMRVELDHPQDETRLAAAIDAFAKWRDKHPDDAELDAPAIMVRTECSGRGVRKLLIFQDRKWAFAFMRFWEPNVEVEREAV